MMPLSVACGGDEKINVTIAIICLGWVGSIGRSVGGWVLGNGDPDGVRMSLRVKQILGEFCRREYYLTRPKFGTLLQ